MLRGRRPPFTAGFGAEIAARLAARKAAGGSVVEVARGEKLGRDAIVDVVCGDRGEGPCQHGAVPGPVQGARPSAPRHGARTGRRPVREAMTYRRWSLPPPKGA